MLRCTVLVAKYHVRNHCWLVLHWTTIWLNMVKMEPLSKFYRIITMLNCLNKIAEKIIINKMFYWEENAKLNKLSSQRLLLDFEQISKREFYSTIDAVISLTHDVQLTNSNNSIVSCLLLDIKNAQSRKSDLIFDEKQSEFEDIDSRILSESLISSMLFLIYIRFLFSRIRVQYNCKILSFINNVIIYVKNKTIDHNCRELDEITRKVFKRMISKQQREIW